MVSGRCESRKRTRGPERRVWNGRFLSLPISLASRPSATYKSHTITNNFRSAGTHVLDVRDVWGLPCFPCPFGLVLLSQLVPGRGLLSPSWLRVPQLVFTHMAATPFQTG